MWSSFKLRLFAYTMVWLAMVQIITEFVGYIFGWPAIFGGLPINGARLYLPGQFLFWWSRVAPGYEWVITGAAIVSGVLAVVVAIRMLLDIAKVREPANENGFFGSRGDARKAGLVRR